MNAIVSQVGRWTRGAAALAMLSALAACVQSTPRIDSQFGESVRGAVRQQSIRAPGAANPAPAAGIDGRAARAALEAYERSFAAPVQDPGAMIRQ